MDLRIMEKICRICFACKKEKMYSLLEPTAEWDLEATTISNLFRYITAEIVETSNLPKHMCIDCVNLMRAACSFKLQYEASLSLFGSDRAVFDIPDDEHRRELCDEFIPKCELGPEESSDNDTENNQESPILAQALQAVEDEEPPGSPSLSVFDFKSDSDPSESDSETEKSTGNRNKDGERLHPCPACPDEFTASDLCKHILSHKSIKKYATISKYYNIISTAQYKAQLSNLTNRESFYNQSEILHKCLYCDKKLKSEDFPAHLAEHKDRGEFKCNKCDRTFSAPNNLGLHRLLHQEDYPYPYNCKYCQRKFMKELTYDRHIIWHTQMEPFECKYCSKRFANELVLKQHESVHKENFPPLKKLFKCWKCRISYRTQDEIDQHECTALNRIFTCKHCKRQFRFASSLSKHIRIKHERNNTLCWVCGKYVPFIGKHIQSHAMSNPYTCSVCSKGFAVKKKMNKHVLTHFAPKPYSCNLCDKSFKTQVGLNLHEKRHAEPHICEVCDKSYARECSLVKHKQQMHFLR